MFSVHPSSLDNTSSNDNASMNRNKIVSLLNTALKVSDNEKASINLITYREFRKLESFSAEHKTFVCVLHVKNIIILFFTIFFNTFFMLDSIASRKLLILSSYSAG